jgi:hypothetical protein
MWGKFLQSFAEGIRFFHFFHFFIFPEMSTLHTTAMTLKICDEHECEQVCLCVSSPRKDFLTQQGKKIGIK